MTYGDFLNELYGGPGCFQLGYKGCVVIAPPSSFWVSPNHGDIIQLSSSHRHEHLRQTTTQYPNNFPDTLRIFSCNGVILLIRIHTGTISSLALIREGIRYELQVPRDIADQDMGDIEKMLTREPDQ